ncbi:MAG: DUF445 family protein [Ammonifex sp.]|jgi:uncharacterized membrane protein YheB (UPF0754 family)|nr:MAG: DUF445 family protein [Ammonifex sp.]
MFYLTVALIPLVGAFIGWVTNRLAVKLLFRPYRPYRLLKWTIQGVLPKRRYELAGSIGGIIEQEILSLDDILQHLKERDVPERTVALLREAIRGAVLEKAPAWVPVAVKKPLAEAVSDLVRDRLPFLIDWLVESFGETLKREVSLSQLIETKLNQFPLEDLERVVFKVTAREIRHIEVMGALLGFLIGLLQVGLLFLVRLTGHTAF